MKIITDNNKLIKFVKKHGYELTRSSGKHHIYQNSDGNHVAIPHKKRSGVNKFTAKKIMDQVIEKQAA